MDVRRTLPAVGTLLQDPAILEMTRTESRVLVATAVRSVVARLRASGSDQKDVDWIREVGLEVERLRKPSLRKVINATGVVLHTNLGRAPLSNSVLREVLELGSGYVNLEYDLEEGRRGSRGDHCAEILKLLTGAEDALVVNNNAAAMVLALRSIADGKEVVISRGELVEIGGSFRIPEILESSGAKLREVGTTNRTKLADYEKAISKDTALILKVHPSNFRQEGFVESVALSDLVKLGRKKQISVAMDLGSASLRPLPGVRRADPTAAEIMATGVDLMMFSGDKMLGGPQAGILLGRADWIVRMKKSPWFRILRCDKLTLALLERVARQALSEESKSRVEEILTLTVEDLREQARSILESVGSTRAGLKWEIVDSEATLGGGSLPEESVASIALSASGSEPVLSEFERRLRAGELPVIARRQEGRILFDMRTVLPEETERLANACRIAAEPLQME